MKFSLNTLLACMLAALGLNSHAQISDGIVKIGVLNDMSGLYADITGPGSVVAAKMAVEDYMKSSKSSLKRHKHLLPFRCLHLHLLLKRSSPDNS